MRAPADFHLGGILCQPVFRAGECEGDGGDFSHGGLSESSPLLLLPDYHAGLCLFVRSRGHAEAGPHEEGVSESGGDGKGVFGLQPEVQPRDGV